jgi:NTE family protein
MRQADHVLFVADAGGNRGERAIERYLADRSPGAQAPRASLALVRPNQGTPPEGTAALLDGCRVDAHYHVAMDAPGDFARLARYLAGAAIGLVLGGGGARGFAHLGVLRALAESGVPVDWVGGTSIGGIIAALVAQGVPPDEALARCRRHFQALRDPTLPLVALLAGRRIRGRLEDAFGAVAIEDLPLPYFCISTNLTRAAQGLHERGPLARAIRASISLPGILPPMRIDADLHVDGGLVNNLPIDVVRAMGVDIVIAVNIGTPLAGREALSSVGGLTTQMINILTEQNVQRSLATLRERDVLLAPDLGELDSGDFPKTRELIDAGVSGALPLVPRLAGLGMAREEYLAWRGGLRRFERPITRIGAILFEGTERTHPLRFAAQLESKPGEPFDPAKAERDARRLAASGDYERADYRLVGTPRGDALVFEVDDKPWGPHYFRIGLDLSTDFTGDSRFNIKISHNRHWLDANGSEWRNQLQIGEEPRWLSEWYHPLNWTLGLSNDWFVSTIGEVKWRDVVKYDNDSGNVLGRFSLRTLRLGVDLGQPWGELGELRLGLISVIRRSRPEILSSAYTGSDEPTTLSENGLRARVVVDQLDYANFPQRGYRLTGEWFTGRGRRSASAEGPQRISRIELSANAVRSWAQHTLNGYALIQSADGLSPDSLGRYTLGGFHQLSGYRNEQLDGNAVVFGRLIYYRRSSEVPLFTRGLWIGASLEAGNVWERVSQVDLGRLRGGGSLFVGADTGIGPLYLGLTYARRGDASVVLFIGRP